MRREHDFYETAPWQVDALIDHLPELCGPIWCPCVGDSSLIRRLRSRRPDITQFVTNDLDEAREADCHGDARQYETWVRMFAKANGRRPAWIVENPPFNVEIGILKEAWKHATHGVAFMARISFAEPTRDRGLWLAEHPYAKRITLERYSFTGNGSTDSATTDWLIWSKAGITEGVKPLSGPFGVSAYGYRAGIAVPLLEGGAA